MQRQIDAAAYAAGEWWAGKLLGQFAEKHDEFSAVVADLTAQELRGECHYDWWGERKDGVGYDGASEAQFDYDPHNLLYVAFKQLWPDARSWDLKQAMSAKTDLRVTLTHMEPKEGYGNWIQHIPVVA